MRRLALLALPAALLAGACAKNIDEGTQIREIAASEDATAPANLPVAKSEQVRPDAQRALENYEKLLDLPQEPAARAETMRRLADLQLEMDEASGGTNLKQSEERLRRSIALYNAVLAERPDAPTNDRVLYQLGRAHQSLGEFAKAEEALLRMTREYPQSPYADDAHFRRAELLFRLEQFDDAAVEYQQVLALKEATPFYEPAQYKYGWAQYRQSNYELALRTFLQILDRELPPGEQTELKAALEGVKAGKKDMTQDALRVVSLSFTQLGGPDAADKFFAKHGEPPYVALVYSALGAHLLEKKRYTDSARTYEAFVDKHPRHDLAPDFLARAVAAQELGGFIEPVVAAKERYVRHFDPSAPYWQGKAASPEVTASLRSHLEDLARYYQARGQRPREDGAPEAKPDFEAAVKWYRRILALYPQDPKAAELRFLMAESLFEAGDTVAAAREYTKVVNDYPTYEKAPDAAFAALLAYQKNTETAPEAQRNAALRESVQAGLKLAEKYPQHPQALPAMTRAAEDLYKLQSWDEAVQVAGRVLHSQPPAPEPLRRTAWTVTADAHYSQKRYPAAEASYTELLKLTPADAPERTAIGERLATSVYKQGEAARDGNDARGAADAFLRVGRLVPAATIRATAEYDAATMLILQKEWVQAAAVLESFRAAYPTSTLLPEVDKKLAVAYESAGKPKDAALVLQRIAARGVEDPATRRDAAWLALSLLDQAQDPRAAAEYEAYVKQYPQPLERAIEAREKLAGYAAARKDEARRLAWLKELVDADTNGGAARTPRTRQLAAQATLELGRVDAVKAQKVALKVPLKKTLPVKKEAMERAIAALSRAVDYGVADVTTAATFETGVLYQDLSKDLLASERPKPMSALEREQYDLLLEEQAFPFEEKAIQLHEENLRRVTQGIYNEWVGKSLEALAQIAPGRYAKREQTLDLYEKLPRTTTAQLGPRPAEPKAKAPAAKPRGTAPKPAADGKPPAPATPAARYAHALQLLKTNQIPEAEKAFVTAVREFPQFTGSYANLGVVYVKQNRKAEALTAFQRAVTLDAGNAMAHNWIGVLSREAGDYPRAEQAYQAALAADSGLVQAQLNLGILYDAHLKRPGDAVAAYRRYDEMTGKKELRAAVWIAELEGQQAASATVQAPPAPAQPPAAKPPAPAAPRAAPRKTGVKS